MGHALPKTYDGKQTYSLGQLKNDSFNQQSVISNWVVISLAKNDQTIMCTVKWKLSSLSIILLIISVLRKYVSDSARCYSCTHTHTHIFIHSCINLTSICYLHARNSGDPLSMSPYSCFPTSSPQPLATCINIHTVFSHGFTTRTPCVLPFPSCEP